MTTTYLSAADRLHEQLTAILGNAEVRGTIYTDQRLATEAATFADDLLKVQAKIDEFFRAIIENADEEFGALTGFEKADLHEGSLCNIEGNWDHPFHRRAEDLRDGATYSAADRTADRRAA